MTCFLIFNFKKRVTSISHNDKKRQGGPNGPLPEVKGLSDREVTKDEKKPNENKFLNGIFRSCFFKFFDVLKMAQFNGKINHEIAG